MKLEDLRTRIDKIDRELLGLIEERMELAVRSVKFKDSIVDPKREEEVFASIDKMSLDLVDNEFRKRILAAIMDEGKRLQGEHAKLVAFQGEHGAYGEVASRRMVPNGVFVPCTEFTDVFRGVSEGNLDMGVVPVENSLEGAVTQSNELLIDTELKVIGEVNVPISHCLVAIKGTDYREIHMVYSHPQALAQCRGFIARNKLEPRPYYDTAGAAKMLAKESLFGAAAIASALSAELYDLEVIKRGIEDSEVNSTRFLLLSPRPYDGEGEKCSIVFAVEHKAGRLFAILRLFAEANINLTRISSSPRRADPGNYNFFLDFDGSDKDENVKQILARVEQDTVHYNFLGCYPVIK